jgi:hypothetical protein
MPDNNYKILGRLDEKHGSGVIGYNTASTGDAKGVEGKTESSNGYGLYTDDDAYVGDLLEVSQVSVLDSMTVDYTGESGGDHGLELIDRSTDNSEQLSIKANPEGTAEIVLQDTEESTYKWGFRASPTGDLYLDNHANIQSRLQLVTGGPLNILGSSVSIADGTLEVEQSDTDGRAIDASGGSIRTKRGVINQQRGDPTTDELNPGENMQFNSDGSGTGSPGDLVYAVNDGGQIKTSIIAAADNAT